jgi:glucans biosynthesis protein C
MKNWGIAMNTVIEKRQTRKYYIDWLRNFVIILLIPFHVARIYDLWEVNYVKSAQLSWGLSWFIVIISYWFMPLMFWLAGTSSWYALEFRTGDRYLKERIHRLLVPLIFGIIIIVPPQGYLAKLSNPDYNKSYLLFLSEYFRDFSDLSGYFGTFTPAHLWFILYLFLFSYIGLPVLLALKKERGRKMLSKLCSYLSIPWVYISMFILLTATEPLPSPGGKNLFFFFFLFLSGYITTADERFEVLIDKIKFKVFLFLIPYIPLFLFLTSKWAGLPDFAPQSILLAFVRNLALWLTLIVLLGYGKKYLDFDSKWLRYMNEAAFPVYVIHQTVLLIIGFFILRFNLGIVPEFIFITLLSFLSCFGIYEVFIRRIRVLRWLFGLKPKVKA